MINIKVIFPGPKIVAEKLRKLEDLLPYQSEGVKLHLDFNRIGAMHCQSSIEEAYAVAGMAAVAALAEKEGMDAVVIESMGDTGLTPCREAVGIPVIGMADTSLRLATMLGRRFGLITAGIWHGYRIESLIEQYCLERQFVGFEALEMQPFFTDVVYADHLHQQIASRVVRLVDAGADTVVLGGSYFLGTVTPVQKLLCALGYHNVLILDPLANALRFARFMVEANLSHNKRIYSTPSIATPVIGYPGIENTLAIY